MSPLFQKSSSGAAPKCHFQQDLLVSNIPLCTCSSSSIITVFLCMQEYLNTYPGSALTVWKQRIQELDMTTAK